MQSKLFTIITLTLLLAGCATQYGQGTNTVSQWRINNEFSSLSFVSIKAGDIGESHVFEALSGSLSETGDFSFQVQLASLNTGIQIRDERMLEHMFQGETADLNGRLDMTAILALSPGDSLVTELTGDLALNGQTTTVMARVLVTRVGGNGDLIVATTRPILLNASALGLRAGRGNATKPRWATQH